MISNVILDCSATLEDDLSMADQIHIEELELEVRIGVPERERAEPQRLTASLTIIPANAFAELNDDINRSVDYAAVCEEVKAFVHGRSDKLLETLAEQIVLHLLKVFPIARVSIELRKFVLPETRHVAVRLSRDRIK